MVERITALTSMVIVLLSSSAVVSQNHKAETVFDNEFASVLPIQRVDDFPEVAEHERVAVGYIPAGQIYGCFGSPQATTYRIELKRRPAAGRYATDAVTTDPTHNRVLFQNSRLRVVSVHFKPGESGPIVDKRPRVIILLDDMHAVVTLPDGHSEPRDGTAGTVYWGNAGSQATKNVGDKPFENIVVELKGK